MDCIHPADLIPVYLQNGLDVKTEKDLEYLGRENLLFLAKFWKNRMGKFYQKAEAEPSRLKRDDLKSEVQFCSKKRDYLRALAARSESKPAIFEKQAIRVSTKVTYFTTEPDDSYVSGIVVKINVDNKIDVDEAKTDIDRESKTGSFSIRVYDRNLLTKYYDFVYTPDGRSLFLTSDFEYYCAHPDYFKFVLYYCTDTLTPSEIAYIDRMLAALPETATPASPDIA
ncbi:hypothetical protein IK146_01875 [Candidatus Saccharibacteria bacterium]|nr:hypothetical protein [Candidatus Saccharibacteria bacterium]